VISSTISDTALNSCWCVVLPVRRVRFTTKQCL